MDPIFADIPDGPLNEIVVTDDDRSRWEHWQRFSDVFYAARPKGTLMELAEARLSVFRTKT